MKIIPRSRYRILRYLIVIVPLALTLFSSFSEPLRSWLLSRYQLRWHVEDRSEERLPVVVTVTNTGSATVSKVRVLLTITSREPRPVADFSFSREAGTPRISFFNSLVDFDSAPSRPASEIEKLMVVLDRHSASRTLFNLEKTFDEILASQLQPKQPLLKLLNDLKKTSPNYDDWHRGWLQRCAGYEIPTQNCREADNLLGTWEKTKQDLLVTAQRKWYEATGVALSHKNNQISPTGEVDFTFDLGGNETAVLQIDYDTNPSLVIKTDIAVTSSSISKTNKVTDKFYLTAPLPFFMFKYHFDIFVSIVLLGALIIWFSWPAIVPKQLLSISKVFRVALKEKDEEYWDYALQRHRFHILQKFRNLQIVFKKTDVPVETDEILDHVRDYLIKVYDDDQRKVTDDARLNRVISSALRKYVAAAP